MVAMMWVILPVAVDEFAQADVVVHAVGAAATNNSKLDTGYLRVDPKRRFFL